VFSPAPAGVGPSAAGGRAGSSNHHWEGVTSKVSKGTLRGQPVAEHIRIDDEGNTVRVIDTRHRYGGFDAGASIAGGLAALGLTVLLGHRALLSGGSGATTVAATV